MFKEGKFGVQEAVCLTTITISSKVFFSSPGYLARFVGTTSWYTTIISDAVAIFVFILVYHLLKRFPGKNIMEIFEITMGRLIGSLFSFVMAAAFIASSGVLLREFTDVLKVFVYPDTPISFLIGTSILAIIAVSFLGLESIARYSKLVAYILLISFILLIILASQNYRFSNLFPLLGFGVGKTLYHGIKRCSAYSEFIILAVFAGSLQGYKYIKKAGMVSLVFSGFVIAGGMFFFTLAFPYYTTQELTAPIYVMARAISYGVFIQRLDPLFLFLWNTATLITVTVLFYSGLSVFCHIFRLNDKRPVIISMAVILFSFAMTPRDFTSVTQDYVQGFREKGWAVFYVLPVISLVTAVIRKRKGEDKNANA